MRQPISNYWGIFYSKEYMSYKKRYGKPKLVGGTQAPEGCCWKVYAVQQHSANVIGALAKFRGSNPSDVLNSLVSFYKTHYQDEINRAFEANSSPIDKPKEHHEEAQ